MTTGFTPKKPVMKILIIEKKSRGSELKIELKEKYFIGKPQTLVISNRCLMLTQNHLLKSIEKLFKLRTVGDFNSSKRNSEKIFSVLF